MAIRGWVPAPGPLAQLQREMNRVFDGVFGPLARGGLRLRAGRVFPPMNVRETDDEYVVTGELPGVEMDDVEVTVTGDHLSVSGQRPSRLPTENVVLHRQERDYGRFSRGLTLPGPVDSSRCEAKLAAGILTVRVPKAEEAKPKRISVEVAPEAEEPKKEA